jgi:glutathione-specific gamma-glutamylcyclotransferase
MTRPGKPGKPAHVARHPPELLDTVLREWSGQGDLWIFGYASLIWRPDFEFAEERFATLHGYHRALKMWSRINRGTPEQPGLVFGLLPGGSCKGVAYRIPQVQVSSTLPTLWEREMPNGGVYDPKWLRCKTALGDIRALAFTLSKRSPSHAGVLSEDHYRQIFLSASGRYGTTRDYAQLTYDKLRTLGIHDLALGKLLQLAKP